MRIRSIRPEFWTSEDIVKHDWETRLIFIGLWSYVDDNGVGRDLPKLIKADLLPLEDDPHAALMQITGALMRLETGGQICRYEVEGKPYLHICAWADNQVISRPSKGRYPRLTCEDAELVRNTHVKDMSPHVNAPLGEGEKGRRGEGDSSSAIASAPADPEQRTDVEALCNQLADRIEANGANRPTVTQRWRDAARLMLDRDNRTYDEVRGCIDWCQKDEFWRTNILSMPKLREKYDQLKLKATTQQRPTRQAQTNGMFDRAMQRAVDRERGAS